MSSYPPPLPNLATSDASHVHAISMRRKRVAFLIAIVIAIVIIGLLLLFFTVRARFGTARAGPDGLGGGTALSSVDHSQHGGASGSENDSIGSNEPESSSDDTGTASGSEPSPDAMRAGDADAGDPTFTAGDSVSTRIPHDGGAAAGTTDSQLADNSPFAISRGFFGIDAIGNSFVYIIDGSSSMSGEPFHRAHAELMRCLRQLSDDQQFCVILFSDTHTPMYGSGDQVALTAASEDSRNRVNEWLTDYSPSGGTQPESALLTAIEAKPDAMFFLTDGGFDPSVVDTVRQSNSGSNRVPIHTVGFMTREGESLLKQISSESGGQYRFAP